MCLTAIRNCIPSNKLSFIPLHFSAISKTIAYAGSYLPGSSCPKTLHDLTTHSIFLACTMQYFERYISPNNFHGKTSLLIGGAALTCFGLYEHVSGYYITHDMLHKSQLSQEDRFTIISQLSSSVFNGMSLFFSGAANIIIGTRMVQKSLSHHTAKHNNL